MELKDFLKDKTLEEIVDIIQKKDLKIKYFRRQLKKSCSTCKFFKNEECSAKIGVLHEYFNHRHEFLEYKIKQPKGFFCSYHLNKI